MLKPWLRSRPQVRHKARCIPAGAGSEASRDCIIMLRGLHPHAIVLARAPQKITALLCVPRQKLNTGKSGDGSPNYY